jgi:hypothetical protein
VKEVLDAIKESFKAHPHVWVLIAVLVVALFVVAHMFRYADCQPESYGSMLCFDRWTGRTVFR